jgi:hypothetical protein
VEINVAEVKKATLYVDNIRIEGKILNVEKNGRIFFELRSGLPISISEMGKRGEVFFEHNGNKYFISGKTFFQPPSMVIINSETNPEIEKRNEVRIEVSSLPATISYEHGMFHKKHLIKSTIINLSMKGARLETDEPLNKNLLFEIDVSLPFHHTALEFHSSFIVRNNQHYRNIFIHGVTFDNIDIGSENNLKKYLFGEKTKF